MPESVPRLNRKNLLDLVERPSWAKTRRRLQAGADTMPGAILKEMLGSHSLSLLLMHSATTHNKSKYHSVFCHGVLACKFAGWRFSEFLPPLNSDFWRSFIVFNSFSSGGDSFLHRSAGVEDTMRHRVMMVMMMHGLAFHHGV